MSTTMQGAAVSGEETWPEALDALVAAPEHHKLLMENDHVRVLETRIAPHDQTPVHTHRWPAALYVLSWSDFIRYDNKGEILLDSRTVEALKTPPTALWSASLPPHSLQNVGDKELYIISVEVKDAAQEGSTG